MSEQVVSSAPAWLAEARKHIGLRELPGAPSSPVIVGWLASLGAWWRDDATPWCGVAVAAWMKAAGCVPPRHWYRAKGWLEFGVEISGPVLGAVVIFERKGGGHVGLVAGRATDGRLMVLGGNQGDAVSLAAFDQARVIGYRWPRQDAGLARVQALPLPIMAHAGASSSNEA